MKRLFRIIFGIIVTPIAAFIAFVLWVGSEEKYPFELLWFGLSGQWEKLPE